MQRVIVIGCGGAGKSLFSRQLAAVTGLPLHHLDALYWQPGWKKPAAENWQSTVDALIAQPAWILDGNFGGTLEQRLAASDTVIFLDVPAWLCLWRVVVRRIRHRGRARPDMTEGCHERLDLRFIVWILGYGFQRRPTILRRLSVVQPGRRAVVLRSAAAARRFLASLV
jgi:adenylate kinase family enzyme